MSIYDRLHAAFSDDADLARIFDDAIGLFLEYRDKHGYEEEQARAATVAECIEGTRAVIEREGDTNRQS